MNIYAKARKFRIISEDEFGNLVVKYPKSMFSRGAAWTATIKCKPKEAPPMPANVWEKDHTTEYWAWKIKSC